MGASGSKKTSKLDETAMPKQPTDQTPPSGGDERVIEALIKLYEASVVGTFRDSERDFLVDLRKLLKTARCEDGDARDEALNRLCELDGGVLQLDRPRRDPAIIHRVRVPRGNEGALFALIKIPSPTQRRKALADQFSNAGTFAVSARWEKTWSNWCRQRSEAASGGCSVAPFDREATQSNAELLALLPKLLNWEGESLVRFASCALCGDSKTLESLAAKEKNGEFRDQLRGKLGRLLDEITEGKIRCLEDLGILPNPRFALVHGPLRLRLNGEWLDLNLLHGPFRLAEHDIKRAEAIETTALRCITVENETSFHELAKLRSGELLIQTSYPGSGTLTLLHRLPPQLEFWHFGDSDEAGFEIFRDLREKSGRNFQSLHMQQGRIPSEQESLGPPHYPRWPFY
jgi:hypothetical protein